MSNTLFVQIVPEMILNETNQIDDVWKTTSTYLKLKLFYCKTASTFYLFKCFPNNVTRGDGFISVDNQVHQEQNCTATVQQRILDNF